MNKLIYLLIILLISAAISYFVYRDSKNKRRTLWAFAITFAAISAIFSIKYY